MIKPLVSIVMGVYNCENTIIEALDSIFSQTYEDIEIIICDDGSTDKTNEITKNHIINSKYPVKFLENVTNLGLNETLNKCIDVSEGKYIARMDGDDISLPSRIEMLVNYLETNTDVSFVSSSMIHFDNNGDWGQSEPKIAPTKLDLIKGSSFAHAAVLMRKSDLVSIGKYTVSKNTLRVEDYDLWIKFYLLGLKGRNLSFPLYKMRDDQNAYKRRKPKYRLNEARIKWKAYIKFNAPIWYIGYVFVPLLKIFVPRFLYHRIHRRKRVNKND
jgi:glycosyltransferase EpsE